MTVVSKGLEGIAVAQTGIADVCGDIGQLIYCGCDINELARKVCFEEVVHLLWDGRLPNRKELEQLADNRLIRPLSEYTAPESLKVVPIDQR